ncbi:hypothetical protein KM043_007467 [Ampulex compressa]|nr:hypothetical protein KM043_007467 [Ampulex compressa]
MILFVQLDSKFRPLCPGTVARLMSSVVPWNDWHSQEGRVAAREREGGRGWERARGSVAISSSRRGASVERGPAFIGDSSRKTALYWSEASSLTAQLSKVPSLA